MKSLIVLACILVMAACGSDTNNVTDAGRDGEMRRQPDASHNDDVGNLEDVRQDSSTADVGSNADTGAASDIATQDIGVDAPVVVTIPPPADWPNGLGWDWVRNNDPMVSGLIVRMPIPSQADADDYFDDFHANTIHLWESDYPTALNGWRQRRPTDRWIAWTRFNGDGLENGQVIGGYGANEPGRIGWQIGDEPRTNAQFQEMLQGFRTVRAADPDALLIANFSYLSDEIDRFIADYCAANVGDIVSYDRYTLRHSAYETLAIFRQAGLTCGTPYWRYVKSYRADNDDGLQSESDLRWAAFVGLLYGYTGHSWFLYKVNGGSAESIPTTLFNDTETWNGGRTPRFAHVAQINLELQQYGKAISNLLSREVSIKSSIVAPDGLVEWQAGLGGDDFLANVSVDGNFEDVLIGHFEDVRRNTYVMLQNPEHSGGDFPTNSANAITVNLSFNIDASRANPANLMRLTKDGTVVSVPLAGSGSNRTLSVTIPAGDIFFFKYDTGLDFAGFEN